MFPKPNGWLRFDALVARVREETTAKDVGELCANMNVDVALGPKRTLRPRLTLSLIPLPPIRRS